ncbi:hypothetical protein HRbin33_02657 [bacterium HR33]|nr:hypothetical protein HRbin33_02657 [bacterium HR33]
MWSRLHNLGQLTRYAGTDLAKEAVCHETNIARLKTGEQYMIRVKRVYEPPAPRDGARFLVDRLWPRGLKKETLRLDGWFKELAPSDRLRRWFAHQPGRWQEFRRRYFAELDRNESAWKPLLEAARRGTVTLLYAARDAERNNAVALKEYLESKL